MTYKWGLLSVLITGISGHNCIQFRWSSIRFWATSTGWCLSHPSEKYEFVSWDDDIPNIWKVIKFMFQTTKKMVLLDISCYTGQIGISHQPGIGIVYIKHESDVKYQSIPTAGFGGAIHLPMAPAWLTGEASRAILDTLGEHGTWRNKPTWPLIADLPIK